MVTESMSTYFINISLASYKNYFELPCTQTTNDLEPRKIIFSIQKQLTSHNLASVPCNCELLLATFHMCVKTAQVNHHHLLPSIPTATVPPQVLIPGYTVTQHRRLLSNLPSSARTSNPPVKATGSSLPTASPLRLGSQTSS